MAEKWNLEPNELIKSLRLELAGRWLVLRCNSPSTVGLVAHLLEHGLRVWTPLQWKNLRYPRSGNKRRVLDAAIPSFVFLSEDDHLEAVRIGMKRGCPSFSLMLNYGMIVRVEGRHLEPMRNSFYMDPHMAESLLWPKVGDEQRINAGSFQGLTCKVVDKTRHHCIVNVGPFHQIKIPPFLLSDLEA